MQNCFFSHTVKKSSFANTARAALLQSWKRKMHLLRFHPGYRLPIGFYKSFSIVFQRSGLVGSSSFNYRRKRTHSPKLRGISKLNRIRRVSLVVYPISSTLRHAVILLILFQVVFRANKSQRSWRSAHGTHQCPRNFFGAWKWTKSRRLCSEYQGLRPGKVIPCQALQNQALG